MVYGILKLLNFAHGDVFMIGAYIGLGVLHLFGGAAAPGISIWLVIVLMVIAAMVGCAVVGVTIERFAYRPLRTAPRIAPLISALGVSFFLQYSVQLLFAPQHQTYDTFLMDGGRLFESVIAWGPLDVSLLRLIVIVGTAGLMLVLWLIVSRTRMGKAMRATAVDRDAAAMMGIDVDRIIVFTFVLGSALAGAGGVLFAMRSDVYPQMGFIVGLAGLRRRRDRRHRLGARRDARGIPARPDRVRHADLHHDPVVEPRHLLGPDRLHAGSPPGAPRQAGDQEGVRWSHFDDDDLTQPLEGAARPRPPRARRAPRSAGTSGSPGTASAG